LEKRLLFGLDWPLIIIILILSIIGIINIYSASSSLEQSGTPVHVKQIYWLIIGFVVMLAIALIGPQRISFVSYPIYLAVLAALVGVLLFGKVVNNAQRWLSLGSFTVQPSEVARIAVILALAYYFQRRDQLEPYSLRQLFIPLCMVALPCALIFKQPDLGTAILIFLLGMSVILVNGMRLFSFLIMSCIGFVAIFMSWLYVLKDYHKYRVISFIFPDKDPLGSSYNQIQSQIAVGSGQFSGKGFMAGTQGQLNFLPEHHTDFAFSVLAEEWGFMGAAFVLLLLAALVIRALMLAYRAKDRLNMLIIVGCTSLIFWPSVINVAMVTGVAPVTGMPLPFISYGGSSLVTNMAAIGLIQGAVVRRYLFSRI
jgi:rod shape determining protein RodA